MTILSQIIIMFILIFVGIMCYKLKIITEDTNRGLSSLLLLVVNSAVIISAFQVEFKEELLKGLLISFVFSFLSFILAIVISHIVIRSKDKSTLALERFSAIYSNCGFIGIPLVQSVYGKEGVFYLCAYSAIFNIFVWTHGIMIMRGKISFRLLLQSLISPAILSTVIGLVLFLFKIILPDILLQSINYLANCNTPLAMIVAGVTVAQTNILKALKRKRIYLVNFVKLLLIPILTMFLLKIFNLGGVVGGVMVLASACPTAVTGLMFAIVYKKDSNYASELFAVTTAASMITIPIVMYINSLI